MVDLISMLYARPAEISPILQLYFYDSGKLEDKLFYETLLEYSTFWVNLPHVGGLTRENANIKNKIDSYCSEKILILKYPNIQADTPHRKYDSRDVEQNRKEDTKYDKVIRWGKNNTVIVALSILILVVGAIGTLYGVYSTFSKGGKEISSAGINYNKDEVKGKICTTLKAYSEGVNKKKFDAYKYFTPKIERFYTMIETSPKKINDYVNGDYNKEFQNSTMYFDESTLSVEEMVNGEFKALVIMYSTYYNAKKKKQYTNFRTKTELRFDNDFRIKYFRQFFD